MTRINDQSNCIIIGLFCLKKYIWEAAPEEKLFKGAVHAGGGPEKYDQ